jgi:tetratricopeptide (TPR) repeat protein
MRLIPFVASVLAITASGEIRAQCSPAVQKLIADQKYDDARAETDALIKKNASDDVALHCMGRIYAAQGKSGEAVDWFEKAVKVNDKNAYHHLQLGNALATEAQKANKLRQPFLARRLKTEFELAVACDPKLADAHEALMEFYLQAPGIVGGSVEKAREQALIISTLSVYDGHVATASIARHDKDLAGEQNALEAALAAAPDTANAWYQLELFYQNQQKWPQAFALLDRALKERPATDLVLHFYYGRASAISGENLDRGERDLKHWLASAAPSAPTVSQSAGHWRLGMIYEKQAKKDSARAEYQLAVSLNPKSDAKKNLDALKP